MFSLFYDLQTIKCKIKIKHKHVAIVKMIVFNDDSERGKWAKKPNGNKKKTKNFLWRVHVWNITNINVGIFYIASTLYVYTYALDINIYIVWSVSSAARALPLLDVPMLCECREVNFSTETVLYMEKSWMSQIFAAAAILFALLFFLYNSTKSEWNRNHYKHE